MKKIIAVLFILTSIQGFAQPNRTGTQTTTGSAELSISLVYKVFTDTLSGHIIIYDKEGYLQRQEGKAIRKISVFENPNIKPELQAIKYFLTGWKEIKPEDVHDFKVKN